MKIFKAQRQDSDLCGESWLGEEWIVEAESREQIIEFLDKLPKGLFHWYVEEIKVVHFSHIRI